MTILGLSHLKHKKPFTRWRRSWDLVIWSNFEGYLIQNCNYFHKRKNDTPIFEYVVAKELLVKKYFLQGRQIIGGKCPELFVYNLAFEVLDKQIWNCNYFLKRKNDTPEFEYVVANEILVKKAFHQCCQIIGENSPELFVYNCKQAHYSAYSCRNEKIFVSKVGYFEPTKLLRKFQLSTFAQCWVISVFVLSFKCYF